jgi:ribonuclease VapC
MTVEQAHARLRRLRLEVVPPDEAQAWAAGELRRQTRAAGLSLGDRACLALARYLGLPAVTADRAWRGLLPDVQAVLIR